MSGIAWSEDAYCGPSLCMVVVILIHVCNQYYSLSHLVWKVISFFYQQTYAEMDPTTAALEKEHEAVSILNNMNNHFNCISGCYSSEYCLVSSSLTSPSQNILHWITAQTKLWNISVQSFSKYWFKLSSTKYLVQYFPQMSLILTLQPPLWQPSFGLEVMNKMYRLALFNAIKFHYQHSLRLLSTLVSSYLNK